jgi:hypothetical protein
MNPQVNYTIARRLSAELQRAGEQARLARAARAARSELSDPRISTRVGTHPVRSKPSAVTALEGDRPMVRPR